MFAGASAFLLVITRKSTNMGRVEFIHLTEAAMYQFPVQKLQPTKPEDYRPKEKQKPFNVGSLPSNLHCSAFFGFRKRVC